MTYRAPLIGLAGLALAACGGSYGSSNMPEMPSTTENAATLASAFSRANSTNGTVAFQAYKRQNAHVARWAADADGCADDFIDIIPGRVVQSEENRACQFDDVELEEVSGGINVSFLATCPQAGAEPNAEGEVPTEEVSFQMAVTDDLSTANMSVNAGDVETLTACEVLLAPEPEEEEEGEAEDE